MKKAGKRRAYVRPKHYTIMDELTASPSEPLPVEYQRHQLTRMYDGLAALQVSPDPKPADWQVVSDAVNLMETLTKSGSFFEVKTNPETGHEWKEPIPGIWHGCDGEPVQITDANGLLMDAITALAMAGRRSKAGGALRLDGAGIVAVRSILADYAALVEVLPARTMIRCHRLTEQRLHELFSGKRKPHDVVV